MSIESGDPASPWREAREAPARPGAGDASRATAMPYALPIVFQGSGSEYFRIWAVNLLLTLVTLGLYYPWAKARRLRYFYGNTFVGDHALDFHGDPRLMLRGFLVAVLLAIAYSVAGKLSATAGTVALVVLAAVWPAMFWMSQRFRLANTSWRGLRFHFSGDLRGAYLALLPLFVPSLLLVAVSALAGGGRPPTFALFLMPIALLLLPYAFWRVKRYQHGHFNFGQLRTGLRAGAFSFYGLALKCVGVAFSLPVIGSLLAVFMLAAGTHVGRPSPLVFGSIVFFAYLVAYLVGQPFFTSRSQNLVWGSTASAGLRFDSDLRFWPLFGLTVKNTLLTMLTLGLYAPFARIATTRLRLQALTLQSALDPDELVASLHGDARAGVTGDAAGDFLGFDIGW